MSAMLQQTLQTLMAHRLRSLLAVIAIVWGIVSVLVLVALGEGFYQVNTKSFAVLMSDTQSVYPEMTSKPWQGLPARRMVTITEAEMRQLEHQPAIKGLAVVYENWEATVTDTQGRSLPGYVRGVDGRFVTWRKFKLTKGSRNITPSDIKNHNRVVVVGWQLANIAGLSLGGQVKVNAVPFTVIGITEQSEGGFRMDNDEQQVMMPSPTFTDLWQKNPSMLLVDPAEGISGVVLRKSLISFFAKQQHFDPTDSRAMYLPDFSQSAKFFTALFRGIQLFLGISGAMTLAVGALGVANIMFLSVTERTREIGIRLAIGATPTSILLQFITEGGLLVIAGTGIGLMLSCAIVTLMAVIGMPDWLGIPQITFDAVMMALSVTGVLALMAAYFPAKRASRLTPVIALNARA
ncbi:ABC transporter permease [uncultured Photobacterium sp.]|uniref:ABC transporter permease n=1 Tax=uncultured Photobacterium sp. TaxID=173973 RepID=UPI00262556A2|nr:ABC transporter permease [uncultured Photobacterium sp.]